MKLFLDNKHFLAIQFNNILYLKIFGFQTMEDLPVFFNTLTKFSKENSGKGFIAYCDLSETILSEPKTAKRINKAITDFSEKVNLKYLALIFLNNFYSYKYQFAKFFYLKNANFTDKVFTDKNNALSWIKNKGYNTDEIELFLTTE